MAKNGSDEKRSGKQEPDDRETISRHIAAIEKQLVSIRKRLEELQKAIRKRIRDD